MRRRARLEADLYEAIVRLCRLAGCDVTRLSQARASRQTPGVPDLYVRHVGVGVRLWIEVKRPGGRLSPAQQAWLDTERRAGGDWAVVDSLDAAAAALAARGIPLEADGRGGWRLQCRVDMSRGIRTTERPAPQPGEPYSFVTVEVVRRMRVERRGPAAGARAHGALAQGGRATGRDIDVVSLPDRVGPAPAIGGAPRAPRRDPRAGGEAAAAMRVTGREGAA